jgi:thymidylate kinase
VIVPDPHSDRPTIALVRDLCAALDLGRVRYCHWKSNAWLARSRAAENDLDLLIARADSEQFSAVLQHLGFKLAWNPRQSLPGVHNYYGYDEHAERLVHVHAHYQLIVGDDLTKNYRIPLEMAFLDATKRDGEFPVPPPELELIMLVIRLTLKHLTWDAVVARLARIPAGAVEELAWLEERIDERRIDDLLERYLPFVDRGTFAACHGALKSDAGTWGGIRASSRLVAELRPCARRPRSTDVRLKLSRRALVIASRLINRSPSRKQLAAGGAVIAIIGADGAGKSTAVDALYQWLSKNFAVTRVHLGRPPDSRATMMVSTLARARSAVSILLGDRRRGDDWGDSLRGYKSGLLVALARDRYLAIRNVRRIATNGGLVICDRWPLPQLSLMDTPRIQRSLRADDSLLARGLAEIEQRYYRAMTQPDVLIVLLVDPEVAVARKPEEHPDFVRARWSEIWQVDWEATGAHVVDAGQSREQVLARLKSLVWSEV